MSDQSQDPAGATPAGDGPPTDASEFAQARTEGVATDRPAGQPPREGAATGAPADGAVDPEGADAPGDPAGARPAATDEVDAEATAEGDDEAPAEEEPDWKDRYVRSVAELDNVRKRARRDVAAGEQRGVGRLARELLPALDNLDRALAHLAEAPADGSAPAADAQTVEGLRIVHRELHAALASVGIAAFDPTGEQFDPRFHEALTQQPAPEGTLPGTVMVVYQQGYRLRDDVLRPAKVVVAG
ncbi:nucleotide exchange factor GrpE [Patulibacter brassicae]|uniref:Protein GrpE n=1 Tax=Patulibacter brassicae TaxID=1705717 RepID=A0ABU4VK95_9ACTN|nr:nucleotide exchange factor GrpE [Patulibacter brassicae]MDX8152248.1 nucleotide exchange factor GrpE [Patulibacter brassicae]